jgi:hypothetical protein
LILERWAVDLGYCLRQSVGYSKQSALSGLKQFVKWDIQGSVHSSIFAIDGSSIF